MDKTINIEALTYILNKLNVNLITEEKTDDLFEEYKKYKKAYLDMRMFDEFDKTICVDALNSFKAHLKEHPYLEGDSKDIILEKIKLVDEQLKIATIAV